MKQLVLIFQVLFNLYSFYLRLAIKRVCEIWKSDLWQQLNRHCQTYKLMTHLVFPLCFVAEHETINGYWPSPSWPELPLCMKKSKRGNPKLVDRDRFEYRMDGKHRSGVIHWRCIKEQCNARLHTVEGGDFAIIYRKNLHRTDIKH